MLQRGAPEHGELNAGALSFSQSKNTPRMERKRRRRRMLLALLILAAIGSVGGVVCWLMPSVRLALSGFVSAVGEAYGALMASS